tara:strand:- start:251 stop:517 length:267 start_codon:yes stop_codon:yes gene_type:complete
VTLTAQGPLARRKATRKRRLIQTARLIYHASAGNVPAQNQRGNDMAKLTPSQKARAKAMSKRKGVKYPNAWSNLAVAKGKSPAKGKKK